MDGSHLERKMLEKVGQIIQPLNANQRNSEGWHAALRLRLCAHNFEKVLNRERKGWSLPYLNELMDKADELSRNMKHKRDKYRNAYLEHHDATIEDYQQPGMKTIEGNPELGATPDLQVTFKGGKNRVVLYHSYDKIDGQIFLDSAGNLRLEEKGAFVYEAAGILQAFVDAEGCVIVVFKECGDDISVFGEILLKREDIESVLDSSSIWKLRKFYYGVKLPELAFSRSEDGFPLRKSEISEDIIDKVISKVYEARAYLTYNLTD